MDFINTVLGHEQDRHIDFLTIHPRTRSTPSSSPINLDALELLTSEFGRRVPILLSGDVFALNTLPFTSPLAADLGSAGDVQSSVKNLSGLAGLMSARAILCNPALFAGYETCPWEAVETFMNNVIRSPLSFKVALHHFNEMCSPGMGKNKSALLNKKERRALMACSNMIDLIDFLDEKISTGNGGRGLRRDNPDP